MKKACGLVFGGLVLAGVVFMTGCATPPVLTEYDLPNQALSVKPAEGLSRVVFFNSSNIILYGLDQSGVISMRLDGKGLATLKIHDYVQIFLDKGEYNLYLVHRDVLSSGFNS